MLEMSFTVVFIVSSSVQSIPNTVRAKGGTDQPPYIALIAPLEEYEGDFFCGFVEASGITDFDFLFNQMLVEQFLMSLPATARNPKTHKSVRVMQTFAMKVTGSVKSQ